MCLPQLTLLNFPYCHCHFYSVHTKNAAQIFLAEKNPFNFPHLNFHIQLHNDSWNLSQLRNRQNSLVVFFLILLLQGDKNFVGFYSNQELSGTWDG